MSGKNKGKKDGARKSRSKTTQDSNSTTKEEDFSDIPKNKVIVARWRVIQKLGSGGCGAVYKVEDLHAPGTLRAMKLEAGDAGAMGVLKLEKKVLDKLNEIPINSLKMYDFGRRTAYSFVVMSLCGADLLNLAAKARNKFAPGSLSKIGIMCLSAIKHIHDIGFVHRDVKPGNFVAASAVPGRDARIIWLLDFGLVRSFIVKDKGGQQELKKRKNREKVQLRGTLRYCSVNTHLRKEQGRVDDLISLLNVLQAINGGLPWDGLKKEKEIQEMKQKLDDRDIFHNSPPEFPHICKYLRTLQAEQRPDYQLVHMFFKEQVDRDGTTFLDRFEWEKEQDVQTCIESTETERSMFKTEPDNILQYRVYPMVSPDAFEPSALQRQVEAVSPACSFNGFN